MKTASPTSLLLALLGSASFVSAAMPKPEKEHAWLQQLVGDWEWTSEMWMDPGAPPKKGAGTESTRALGGFWVVAQSQAELMGQPFVGVMTLGFDPAKKKYVGTWTDSMASYLWTYEGTVDDAGKTLTLHTTGPCMLKGGAMTKFKEVLEIKSPDLKTFTSSMQGDDGKWVMNMKIDYRRKK